MTKEIKIDDELCSYIERLQYECAAAKDVITFFLQQNMDLTESFEKYDKKYSEAHAAYEMAKQKVTDIYVKKDYPNANWNLNFDNHTLTITSPD